MGSQDKDTCCTIVFIGILGCSTPEISIVWFSKQDLNNNTTSKHANTDVGNFTGLHSFDEELQITNDCQEREIFSFLQERAPR